jgi:Ca-activated chloride channel family protein
MKTRRITVALLLVLSFVFSAAPALADGFIVPGPPGPVPPIWPPQPPVPPVQIIPYLTVKYHHVEVIIDNQVATTRIDQVFINDYDREIEGTYMFPLPEDAAISTFDMWVDGKKLEGRVLPKDEARGIYESIVRSRRDPALLEYVGRNTFQARIYPIPARGEKRVQIEYSQLLPADNGLVKYTYPLNTEKFSPKPLKDVSVSVQIKAGQAIKSVYSPSHDVAVIRKSEREAVASYEAVNVRPDKDFVLYYSTSADDVGLSLLTYRPSGEDGYFLLLAAPKVEVDANKVTPKDVILVLDTSGSMEGQKLTQAKDALRFVVDHLNSADRFNIVTFNSAVTRYADGFRPASDRAAAGKFVDAIRANGSTNIDAALREAIQGVSGDRPAVIIFLTDGLPTAGVTDVGKIAENMAKAAPRNVRLFPFGVGYDVNTVLLDTLASQNRGASAYVKPEENIEDSVSSFYAKVGQPVLTDLKLDLGSARAYDIYPDPLPDLFAGSQLVLAGRYRGDGSVAITLTGVSGDKETRFTYSGDFPKSSLLDPAIARLWATRKIGYLLTQIRLHGADKELVNEIVGLATRFGIVTPYTSFLVDERQNLALPGAPKAAAEQLFGQLATPAPAAGPSAVQGSQALDALRSGSTGAGQAPGQLKQVDDKAFVLRQGAWIDTTYKEGMKLVKIAFGSDDLFALVASRPDWGKYFAVGDRLTVVLDGVAYQVGDEAAPPLVIPATPTPAATRITGATPAVTRIAGPMATPTVRTSATPARLSPTPAGLPPATELGPLERFWQWLSELLGIR